MPELSFRPVIVWLGKESDDMLFALFGRRTDWFRSRPWLECLKQEKPGGKYYVHVDTANEELKDPSKIHRSRRLVQKEGASPK